MDGLKILTGADGKPRSKYWYARFTRQGVKTDVSLAVVIRGNPPTDGRGRIDLKGRGDAAFEKSRKSALDALAKMRAAARVSGKTKDVRNAETADLMKRYYRAREGKSMGATETPLADLPAKWRGLKRDRPPTEAKMAYFDSVFARFASFARKFAADRGGYCETVNEITEELASAFFDEIRGRYAWETVKSQMSLLSGAFTRWATNGRPNPFRGIIKRNHNPDAARVNKRPLSEAELARLFDAAADDDFLRPLIDCAACTGMRIGDVCNLKWADVDLRGGFIDVTTAKAGVRVTIPIFGRLKATLERLAAETDAIGSPLVFPRAAAAYNHKNAQGKPDRRLGIIRAVKPLFALAVCDGKSEIEDAATEGDEASRPKTPDEVCALIEASRFTPGKKERLAYTYRRFAAGATYAQIAAETGRCKAVVSQDLESVEDLTGERIRRGGARPTARAKLSKRALMKRTRAPRGVGMFAASVYGWHSLRTSFVTLALQYGVPIEDVRKIVGHTTVRTTEGYNRAGKAHAAERVRRQMAGGVFDAPRLPNGETVDAAPVVRALPVARGGVPMIADAAKSTADRLRELKALADEGLITSEEYAAKRSAIIGGI